MQIHQQALREVQGSLFSSAFRKPLYTSWNFARIPATISYLLTGEERELALPSSSYIEGDYDLVVLLFLDALGFVFLKEFYDHPFVRSITKRGVLSPITVQFPSTTSAHVTTIHTGIEVGQTGIYEWFQYEPLVDEIIAPLLFSRAHDTIQHSLLSSSHLPTAFFPFRTFYEKLHEKEVESYVLQEVSISDSPYSQALCKGAHRLAYKSLKQGLQTMRELIETKGDKKRYLFLYHSAIDATGHRKGIRSSHFAQSIKTCLDLLEEELLPFLPKKAALLATADHGMVPVRPKKMLFVNELCSDLDTYIARNHRQAPLAPAGSCRDLFLHIKPAYLEEAYHKLSLLLQGQAEVWKVQDLIAMGFFGEHPVSLRFCERVGNLVILPYVGKGVFWREPHHAASHFLAAHGGLSPEEMESFFAFIS